jgi:hypothetical protein
VGSTQAGAVDRVNVCAAFEEQLDDSARLPNHSTMERRASTVISTIQQVRVRIQKFTNPSNVAGLRSQMNWVILKRLRRRGPPLSLASPLENYRNGIMAAFPCHSDQAVAIVPVPFRVRSGIEQHLNNLGVPFADGEVNRRRIEIAATAQRRISIQEPTHRGSIAGGGGNEDFPVVVFDASWPDHAYLGWLQASDDAQRPAKRWVVRLDSDIILRQPERFSSPRSFIVKTRARCRDCHNDGMLGLVEFDSLLGSPVAPTAGCRKVSPSLSLLQDAVLEGFNVCSL